MIDLEKLRAVAELASNWKNNALGKFREAFTPASCLALLDRLAELKAENERLSKLNIELRANLEICARCGEDCCDYSVTDGHICIICMRRERDACANETKEAMRSYVKAAKERDQLRAELAEVKAENERLRATQVPPYTSCAMCGDSGCMEGEWMEGSEVECILCSKVGAATSFEHSSGHTYWVLTELYDYDDEEVE